MKEGQERVAGGEERVREEEEEEENITFSSSFLHTHKIIYIIFNY